MSLEDRIYAIVETGGKQYKVSPGQVVDVERLPVEAGGAVELDRVLLIADGDGVIVGKPTIEGARILATVQSERKGRKITVFRYKSKVRYRRKTGHRQLSTRLTINQILDGKGAS